jgi:hypothetical protein
VARIEAEVAALRGLEFRTPVAVADQSRQAFRQVVREALVRELPAQKNSDLSRALAAIGFLPRPIDLSRTLEEAQTTQVAAYYDPRARRFSTVGNTAHSAERDSVIAHELVHALQDQHFGLIAYQGGEGNTQGLTSDERDARDYVVEGEATFVMFAYQLASGRGRERHLGPLQVAGVRMSLTMASAVDYVETLGLLRTGAGGAELDAETRVALDGLAKLPPLLSLSLVEPYMKGAFLISEVWGRGGWPAVARLYSEPPQSTEQVLHPVEKLLDRRDLPVRIEVEPPAGLAQAPRLMDEVAGEMAWRAYFKTWGHRQPERAASGWGGDRILVWQREGSLLALIATRWDTAEDAAHFEADYLRSLRLRFAGAPPAGRHAGVRRQDGTYTVVERRGLDVDIVDGARAGELEPLLAAARSAARAPRTP